MRRTVAAMAIVLILVSLGVGYVVGRSGGGDTGDSISSRLANLVSPAPSARQSTPDPGTPGAGTPPVVIPAMATTPEPAIGPGLPIVTPVPGTPVPATLVLASAATPTGSSIASTPAVQAVLSDLGGTSDTGRKRRRP